MYIGYHVFFQGFLRCIRVASLPEVLSIKKLSLPCQYPRSIGFTVVGRWLSPELQKFHPGGSLTLIHILIPNRPATAAPPFFIGVLSLLPPRRDSYGRVYPIVQASLLLFVVPVFTATSLPGIYKTECTPK